MGAVSDILRSANERNRRFAKVRAAYAALTFEEQGHFVAEALGVLKAGPPKKRSRRRKPVPIACSRTRPTTVRERVTSALAEHAPLNTAGIHAVIERTSPGVVSKNSVAAEVSVMLTKGLLVKAGIAGRGASYALANGQGGAH